MRIGVPKETAAGERRVALVPEVVAKLVNAGHEVLVQRGAGDGALIPDEQYEEAGASAVDSAAEAFGADIVVKVAAPSAEETELLGSSTVLIGFLAPLTNGEGVTAIAQTGATSFAMEAIPRISRAQSMDALSSQANIAGYRSALIGAQELGRFFPMLMTAAGTIRPATVLVLGAGVAGLQAIATARRLGAVVQGFDVRAAVKEQVESLGANFLEFDLGGDLEGEGGYAKELTPEQQARQQELMAEAIGKVRRRDHDRAGARPPRSDPRHRAGREADEARFGDRRPGRRAGRQLRADGAGRDRDPPRREDPGAAERALDDGRARLAALRAQHRSRCSG